MNKVGLADLIYQVKDELLARHPMEEAKGLPVLFWIDQIELELSVAVTTGKSGGIKLSVIPVGAEASGSHLKERGNTVKVRLTPLLSHQEIRDLLARNRDFQDAVEKLSLKSLTRDLDTEQAEDSTCE